MGSFADEYKIDTLDEINDAILEVSEIMEEIESGVKIEDKVDELFRFFHSIKGNANSADFQDFSDLAHSIENVLIKVRDEDFKNTKRLSEVIHEAVNILIDDIERAKKDLNASFNYTELKNKFNDLVNGVSKQEDDQFEDDDNFISIDKTDKIRFLLVDDEPMILETLQDVIGDFDGDITIANDGLEGFEKTKFQEFDIIITDYYMPNKNGLEFIQELRKSKSPNTKTPVVLVTAYKPTFKRDESGWDDVFFLEKPFKIDQIEFVIKCCLRLKKKAA